MDLTLAYTNLEFSRILREPYGTRARDYYRKISVLSRNFGAIKEHSVHQAIVISYANLVMSCCVLGTVTMEEAFGMWEEMKELQASDALAATRESEPDVGSCWIFSPSASARTLTRWRNRLTAPLRRTPAMCRRN